MKYNICVVTTTRADYGILKPLLKKISYDNRFDFKIAVGGTHLYDRFGRTIDEIRNDNLGEIETFEYSVRTDSSLDICNSASSALSSFSDLLRNNDFDLVLLLGDRYEMLSVAYAAYLFKIPIAHLHGGEITEGALDDSIRHAITKLSTFHFTANDNYKNRVIQMGEDPSRVFNVGSLSLENIKNNQYHSKEELLKELGITDSLPYVLVTYHPETNSNNTLDGLNELLMAIDMMPEFHFIITMSNADQHGDRINEKLIEFADNRKNVFIYSSLGSRRYLSAVKYASLLLGNSSSGIIEAPSLRVPTVNVGDRQKGRMKASSVFDVVYDANEIVKTVKFVLEKKKTLDYSNPYGDGNTSEMICDILYDALNKGDISKMSFYDLT